MKFYSIVLVLFITTVVFSYNLNDFIIKEQKISKNKYENEAYEAIKKCENDLEKYMECIYGSNKFTLENIDEVCNIFYSEKCQTFFKDPMNSVPVCATLPQELQNSYKNLFTISEPSMKFFCQKRENGKFCPMVKLELSGNNKSEKKIMKSVKETCKFTECSEAALNLYEVLSKAINHEEAILNEDNEAMENNKIIINILKTLQSDNCNEINSKYKSNLIKRENIKKILKHVKLYL